MPSSRISREKELFKNYLNNGKGKCHFDMTQFAALDFVRPEHTGIGFAALLEDAYMMKHSIIVMNAAIHCVSILPLLDFEDESLPFAFSL
ncbi:hypothetical protein DSO57_1022014 [Entomophthora muscae]|uniref:Uncharacterized protein n=1 Tax=Entomophthora muscae TaxID=34485 RepID=A0ACC2TE99_9FUNG|nr:hypothetical protein DSO57_1022014 [Entomophthora muscae]